VDNTAERNPQHVEGAFTGSSHRRIAADPAVSWVPDERVGAPRAVVRWYSLRNTTAGDRSKIDIAGDLHLAVLRHEQPATAVAALARPDPEVKPWFSGGLAEAMAVCYQDRDEPCLSCGAIVAVKVISPDPTGRARPDKLLPIHDDDGTPADHQCTRNVRPGVGE